MVAVSLTRMRLAGGMWEGLLSTPANTPPRLRVRHADEVVAEPETEPDPSDTSRWFVRFRLPVERISEGVQTFAIEDVSTGDLLAHETVIAGDVLDEDLHSEVALLRAELDMLKRAFRRHCSELAANSHEV